MKVLFIDQDGQERELLVEQGSSVMENAVAADIEGIDADCGGSCSCATCHVYVDEAWLDKLPPMQPMERDMLSFAVGRQANSRLSCQLVASAELDGIRLTVPACQVE